MKKILLVLGLAAAGVAQAEFKMDKSVMSDAYWAIWNDTEQAKINADIERNRKVDCEVEIVGGGGESGVPVGTKVEIEQLDHEFRFGAHIFNFDQLGKTEYNDAYKSSYGQGGIFNQATVAFYWNCYEPVPGRLRAGGDYEDTARFWNSLTRDEAMAHPFWRRPAPGPVIDFLKSKGVFIHGHILVWGSAKPYWIYDWYCPESEKRAFDALGIPRHATALDDTTVENWNGTFNALWTRAWQRRVYGTMTEDQIEKLAPVFTRNMRRIFRKRVFDVAGTFGDVVDSWDVVNESSLDWTRYRKSRTGRGVWFSGYGLMPGDYPLHALLDAKEAMSPAAKLAINDYNVCNDFLAQVKDLESEGAKIDIVGCQMHLFNTNDCMRLAKGETNINWVSTPQVIQDRLDMMAKTGKPLHVSEITITSPGPDDRARMIQAILTRNIYRKWFSHKALMGITWWNTVDGGGVRGEPLVSGLFTSDLKKKPAYLALDELINREWKTKMKVEVEGRGRQRCVRFRGFRGKYRMSWACPKCGKKHAHEFYLTGDGVKGLTLPVPEECRVPVRHFTVDGKAVELGAGESRIDLGEMYPGAAVKGAEGTKWAEVSLTLEAPKEGTYDIYRHNDYFGEMSVNGGALVKADGPWDTVKRMSLALKAGKNVIRFRTRAGISGHWTFGIELPGGSPLWKSAQF